MKLLKKLQKNTGKKVNGSKNTDSIDLKVLSALCNSAEELFQTSDIDEIHHIVRNEFGIDCSKEDIEKVYALRIAELEAELLYKQYGYETNS